METTESTGQAKESTRKQRRVIVESQSHLWRVRVPGAPVGGGGERGAIQRFTRQSRKRMLEKLARIDTDRAGFVCFITLTYPDRDGAPTAIDTERDRRTFLKRIGRAHPEASGIWRREHEARKSGPLTGVIFPHYHMMLFGLPFVHHSVVNDTWREVIRCEEYARTEIKGVKSWRQALYYLAKYMAKPEEEPPETREHAKALRDLANWISGRSWRGNTPAEGGGAPAGGVTPEAGTSGEAARSLVYGTYMTGGSSGHKDKQSIGRSWGVFNRRLLPFGEKEVNSLPEGQWVEALRSLAREHWPGVPDDPNCGFTLFVSNADEWMSVAVALEEGRELNVDDGAEVPF